MSSPDYYKILAVEKSANIADIKKAYRKRAFECHPDHGGSDAEMKLLNEAWEILSNPEARAAYDAAMANQNNQEARRKSQEYSANAQRKAAHYPTRWEDFEKYLAQIMSDIADAEYQIEYINWKQIKIPVPVSDNSATAIVFILLGAFLGMISLPLFLGFFYPVGLFLSLLMGFAVLGAWMGAMLHMLIKSGLK